MGNLEGSAAGFELLWPVLVLQGPAKIVMYEAVQFRGWFGMLLTLQSQPVVAILDGTSPVFQDPSCYPKVSQPSPDPGTKSAFREQLQG